MNDDANEREAWAALETLETMLTERGLGFARGPGARFTVAFTGRCNEWHVYLTMNPDWFHAYIPICGLPKEPGLAAELTLWLARTNANLTLLKYSITKADRMVIELEVPAEHVDDEAVYALASRLYWTAEADYPAIFKIVTGDNRLAALADTFSSDAVAGGVDEALRP